MVGYRNEANFLLISIRNMVFENEKLRRMFQEELLASLDSERSGPDFDT